MAVRVIQKFRDCDICGKPALKECSEWLIKDKKQYRCGKCFDLEAKIRDIRERRLKKKEIRLITLKEVKEKYDPLFSEYEGLFKEDERKKGDDLDLKVKLLMNVLDIMPLHLRLFHEKKHADYFQALDREERSQLILEKKCKLDKIAISIREVFDEDDKESCSFCGKKAIEIHSIGDFKRCQDCYEKMNKLKTIRERRNKKKAEKERKKEGMRFLVEYLVKNLSKEWLAHIPATFLDKLEEKVFTAKDSSRTKSGTVLMDFLNERFVREQLELMIPGGDKRDSWYLIDETLKSSGGIDYAGSQKNQYIAISNAIKSWCKKTMEFYGLEYWGYVLDKINLKSHGRAMILDLNLENTILDVRTLEGYTTAKGKRIKPKPFVNAPFFFLMCEKKMVLEHAMNGVIQLGYKGWYGINTQGYGTTNVIRLLLKFSKIKKFYIFFLHDYDLDGLTILFDLKRYFNVESVGLNPLLIKRSGIDTKGFLQKYKTPSGKPLDKQIEGAKSSLESIKIDDKTREMYQEWIKGCKEGRAELQSLTAIRLIEDLTANPARDFVDYIQHILESTPRIYDVNRYRKTTKSIPNPVSLTVNRPDFIDEIIEEIQEKAVEEINNYLNSINLSYDYEWRQLVQSNYDYLKKGSGRLRSLFVKYDKIRAWRFRRVNKRYTDSLLKIGSLFSSQDSKLWNISRKQNRFLKKRRDRQETMLTNLIKRTPEYKNTKKNLEKVRDLVMETLKNIDFDSLDEEENEN